jgi:hypothetical protein
LYCARKLTIKSAQVNMLLTFLDFGNLPGAIRAFEGFGSVLAALSRIALD